MLSENATEDQRVKVLSDVEGAITTAGGQIDRNDDWGRRPMAYEIRHQPEAEYHLLQFKSPPALIEELSHTLHITDGVLRFRVIKNRPGTPPAPSSPPPVVAAAAGSGARAEAGRPSGDRAGAPAALAAADEAPPESADEAPADPAGTPSGEDSGQES